MASGCTRVRCTSTASFPRPRRSALPIFSARQRRAPDACVDRARPLTVVAAREPQARFEVVTALGRPTGTRSPPRSGYRSAARRRKAVRAAPASAAGDESLPARPARRSRRGTTASRAEPSFRPGGADRRRYSHHVSGANGLQRRRCSCARPHGARNRDPQRREPRLRAGRGVAGESSHLLTRGLVASGPLAARRSPEEPSGARDVGARSSDARFVRMAGRDLRREDHDLCSTSRRTSSGLTLRTVRDSRRVAGERGAAAGPDPTWESVRSCRLLVGTSPRPRIRPGLVPYSTSTCTWSGWFGTRSLAARPVPRLERVGHEPLPAATKWAKIVAAVAPPSGPVATSAEKRYAPVDHDDRVLALADRGVVATAASRRGGSARCRRDRLRRRVRGPPALDTRSRRRPVRTTTPTSADGSARRREPMPRGAWQRGREASGECGRAPSSGRPRRRSALLALLSARRSPRTVDAYRRDLRALHVLGKDVAPRHPDERSSVGRVACAPRGSPPRRSPGASPRFVRSSVTSSLSACATRTRLPRSSCRAGLHPPRALSRPRPSGSSTPRSGRRLARCAIARSWSSCTGRPPCLRGCRAREERRRARGACGSRARERGKERLVPLGRPGGEAVRRYLALGGPTSTVATGPSSS